MWVPIHLFWKQYKIKDIQNEFQNKQPNKNLFHSLHIQLLSVTKYDFVKTLESKERNPGSKGKERKKKWQRENRLKVELMRL